MTKSSTDSSLVERLTADRDEALRFATNLLTSYVNKYCDPVPEWAPLPDLIGVLTQIDNASTVTADILAQSQAAEVRISTLERELVEMRSAVEQLRGETYLASAEAAEFHRDNAVTMWVAERARATAAEAKVARMVEALEPFGKLGDIPENFDDAVIVQAGIDYTMDADEVESLQKLSGGALMSDRATLIVSIDGLTAGDFRRARSALQSEKDREELLHHD